MADSIIEEVDVEGDVICEESTNQVDRINDLIKQFVELVQTINKSKGDLQYWKSQLAAVSTSNWAGETEHNELQKRETQLRTTVSDLIEAYELKQQEVKSIQARRAKEWSEQCDRFQSKCMDYANNFSIAQFEYSTHNLSKDIGECRTEFKKIKDELVTIMKELQNAELKCGLNSLYITKDDEDVWKISNLITDVKTSNNNLSHEIKSAEDILKSVQNKLKQSQAAIDTYIRK